MVRLRVHMAAPLASSGLQDVLAGQALQRLEAEVALRPNNAEAEQTRPVNGTPPVALSPMRLPDHEGTLYFPTDPPAPLRCPGARHGHSWRQESLSAGRHRACAVVSVAYSRGRARHDGWDLQLAEQVFEPCDVLVNDPLKALERLNFDKASV